MLRQHSERRDECPKELPPLSVYRVSGMFCGACSNVLYANHDAVPAALE